MNIIEESHSKLSVALKLSMAMIRGLQPRIELPRQSFIGTVGTARDKRIERLRSAWDNFLRRPLDFLISFLLSCIFVGIFVAGSSGSVLSAGIVSDTTALASSSRCYPPDDITNASLQAAAYSQQCYRRPPGTEGCNYLYNQQTTFTEKLAKHVLGIVCAL